jgi:hypothetical protein
MFNAYLDNTLAGKKPFPLTARSFLPEDSKKKETGFML